MNMRKVLSAALNILILLLGVIGIYLTFFTADEDGVLLTKGLANLKYFTVLSNIFCIAVSFRTLISRKTMPSALRLTSVSAVFLTFAVIAFFLAPAYPDLNMYKGANLIFHLIIPLLALGEFFVTEIPGKIPLRDTFIAALFSLVYGTFYVINILVNGIGEWPSSNDWYGFLNWGYMAGALIFLFIVITNWITAFSLRLIRNRATRS